MTSSLIALLVFASLSQGSEKPSLPVLPDPSPAAATSNHVERLEPAGAPKPLGVAITTTESTLKVVEPLDLGNIGSGHNVRGTITYTVQQLDNGLTRVGDRWYVKRTAKEAVPGGGIRKVRRTIIATRTAEFDADGEIVNYFGGGTRDGELLWSFKLDPATRTLTTSSHAGQTLQPIVPVSHSDDVTPQPLVEETIVLDRGMIAGPAWDLRLYGGQRLAHRETASSFVLCDYAGLPETMPTHRVIDCELRKTSRDLLRRKGRKYIVHRSDCRAPNVVRFDHEGRFEDVEVKAGTIDFTIQRDPTIRDQIHHAATETASVTAGTTGTIVVGTAAVAGTVAVAVSIAMLDAAIDDLLGVDDDEECWEYREYYSFKKKKWTRVREPKR